MTRITSMVPMLILILVIILTFSRVPEARLLQERHHQGIVHKHVDSKQILHQLLARYKKVELDSTDRKSPGGPDPQHH